MPALTWIGKEAVVNHDKQVPFHLLEEVPKLSCGGTGEGNLIVEGDNLVALKALLPYYAGQVKCIYIDPPYNTGNENWVYNDAVNSPEMKTWLGKVVGGEAEDLSRHDKWLCMMYPRLAILKQFLCEDGAIFVSIDDNEVYSLRHIMNEIFGERNFIATIIWQKMDSPKNTAIHLSEDHDYIVIYSKRADVWRPNKVPRTEAMIARYKNPDNDPRGPWLLSDLAARNFYAAGRYPITTPSGRVIDGPPAGSYWRISKERFEELERDGRIWWGRTGANRPGIKRFLSEVQEGVVPQTLWPWNDVGSTRHAKQELSELMAAGASSDLFITPKPSSLIERVLQIATKPGDLVLDSFAGSGTTGHAVLKLNAANPTAQPRHFIMIEIEAEVARKITAERVTHVALGYENAKGQKIDGLGGGFKYCRLATPLFNEDGAISKEVKFADLAAHLYFTETGQPLPDAEKAERASLLGMHNGVAIYLLFNGILGDKKVNGGNVLTGPILTSLPPHDGPKIIYGESNRLGTERMKREGITFKQIPYRIRVG